MRSSASGVILNYSDLKDLPEKQVIEKLIKVNQVIIDDIFMLVDLCQQMKKKIELMENDIYKLRGML